MGVFGDRLRREREMRGVTLEEISESTKISKRALQAMEDENFDVLPGGIFNKGFVRAYARFLGIDEDQAVADFLAVSIEQQAVEDKFPLDVRQDAKQPLLNPKRSLLPVILALLVLVAVAGAWTFWSKHKAQENATESPGGPAGKAADQPNPAPATLPDNADRQGPSAHETLGNQDANTPGGSGPGTSSGPGAEEQSSSDSAHVSKKAFTVSVRATEDSWISIVADGKPKMEGILNAEKQRSFTAGRELVLVTGNAGGIDVSYNGKSVAPLGEKQQKKTVTFTPRGVKAII